LNTHLNSQITAGLLKRAAEARAGKGASLELPDSSTTTASFMGLKTTLQGSLSYAGGATHWSPSLPNPFISRNGDSNGVSNGDLNYRYQQNPIARVAPASHTTKEVGNWAPMALTPGHVQQLHERLCKDSNALKLGPSTWATSDKLPDEVTPPQAEAAPVPFIDFLGVGAA